MTDRKIIVNELLTFIQNKIDVLDELSILQICASNFTELEVETAKSELYNYLNCGQHMTRRKGDDKVKKNLKDILRVLKESDPDNQPIFVARDLNRLPPVTFDHVDVTRLLKDLTYLKNEINNLRSDCVTKSEMMQLQVSMRNDLLRNDLRHETMKRNVRTRKLKTSGPAQAESKTEDSSELEVSCEKSKVTSQKRSCSVTSLDTVVDEECTLVPSYRDIVNARPKASTIGSRDEMEKDGFKVVASKKRSKPNMRGTLANNGRIQVVEALSSIYVSRTKKSVTEDDIGAHIRELGEAYVSIELLQQKVDTTFNSFKVVVAAERINQFLDPNFWPTGVVFRRYRERFQRKTTNSKLSNNI